MTDFTSSIHQLFPELTNIEFLVCGGQKHVFSSTHPEYGKLALKVFEDGYDIERVQREVRAVNSLRLESCPRIREEGIKKIGEAGFYYFLEEFIEGEGLDKKLKSGNLTIPETIDIAFSLLKIIVDAESKSIVHRDIKPSNIIIDQEGKLWLLDYGIARHIDMDSLTNTSDVMAASTPGYAPIEQFRNRKAQIDSRTDLFAIGVTLYECLTGTNPYRVGAGNFFEILDRVETDRLPKLSGLTKDGELEELVFTLTQPRQEHRPLNAEEAFNWINDIKENQ